MTVSEQGSIEVTGPSSGAPIVFVHGTGLSRAAWTPQRDGLGDTYRVVTLDLPGHGRLAARRFTLEGAVEEVGRTIDEAAGGRAVVVGASLGGYVAIELAARRPEAVRGLVLVGASQEPVGLAGLPFRALAIGLERLDDVDPSLVGRIVAVALRRRYPSSIAEPIIAAGVHPGGGATALRSVVGRRFGPRLAAFDGPVLLLNGELDVLFRLGSRRFAGAGHDVRRARLRGAAHLANLDRPAVFDAAIRDFVEGLQGRS